jgi:hypothetical protein
MLYQGKLKLARKHLTRLERLAKVKYSLAYYEYS